MEWREITTRMMGGRVQTNKEFLTSRHCAMRNGAVPLYLEWFPMKKEWRLQRPHLVMQGRSIRTVVKTEKTFKNKIEAMNYAAAIFTLEGKA
jgi:hypothetical protein